MYLGQVSISTDIIIKGNAREIKIGLIPINKRLFTKYNSEKNKNIKFNTKNANCHSLKNISLQIAISKTGTEKKNKCGL